MRYPPAFPGSPSSEARAKEVAHMLFRLPTIQMTSNPLFLLCFFILQDTTLDCHLLETQAIIVACYSTITDHVIRTTSLRSPAQAM